MPNWCENEWKIYAKNAEDLKALKADLLDSKKQIDFNILIPMPKVLENTVEKHERTNEEELGHIGYHYMDWKIFEKTGERVVRDFNKKEKQAMKSIGYEHWLPWCKDHWGTKWNASNTQIGLDDDRMLFITFQTAWGPPKAFYYALLKKHKNAQIEAFYKEPNIRISGWIGYDD